MDHHHSYLHTTKLKFQVQILLVKNMYISVHTFASSLSRYVYCMDEHRLTGDVYIYARHITQCISMVYQRLVKNSRYSSPTPTE